MSDPIAAFRESVLALARERAECIKAETCIHEHLNGACPYSEGVTS